MSGHDDEVDLLNLPCPMPIIKIKKFLAQNADVMQFKVIVNDRGALKDIPAFCKQQKLKCNLLSDDTVIRFEISR